MNDELTSVYVLMSDEIQEVLAAAGVGVDGLLRHEGVDVETRHAADPTGVAGDRTKEPVTLILASAGLVAALTPVLTRVIQALSHRSVIVREKVLVPVEDARGDVVRASDGRPILYWTDRARHVDAGVPAPGNMSVAIEGPLGLKIEYEQSNGEQ
jgi:hypothetical protein